MAKWVQSYRDLPLLLNQWCNVLRWEMRTRLFLRSAEFLWQEGHTAHATEADARAYARRILHEAYEDFMVNILAMPVTVGLKTVRERFAGANRTYTLEAMMRDGKALQMGTSHELGQNFARVFDIDYLSADGRQEFCWTTSWGSSTRMVGGLIMCHGDDNGLRVPPRLAPIQVQVTVIKDGESVVGSAVTLRDALAAEGVRTGFDDRVDIPFGRRAVDAELRGYPVRIEVGPRDLAAGNVTLVRRIAGSKTAVPLEGAVAAALAALEADQQALYDEATSRLTASTADVASLDEAIEAAGVGVARVRWDAVGTDGETKANETGVTVRCLTRADGSVPDSEDEPDLVAYLARSY
jgi:prolyl-tRNA synthetase